MDVNIYPIVWLLVGPIVYSLSFVRWSLTAALVLVTRADWGESLSPVVLFRGGFWAPRYR